MILGLDPGERRTGVALADEEVRFAYPVEVIDARATDTLRRVLELVRDHSVTRIVVGRPLSLSGAEGPAVAARHAFVEALRAEAPVPVEEWDERLTTVVAERGMRGAGTKAATRNAVRDAVAAQVLLQSYLDARSWR